MISKLSIVIPCHNEASNVSVLFTALQEVLNDIDADKEIIFVDDGSKDNTFLEVEKISHSHNFVHGICLSRNFGHQIALLAGLEKSSGDVIVMLDGDMQHPPSVIPELIQKYEEGYEIVNTRRVDDASTKMFKKVTSKFFYIVINKLSDVKIEPFSADFRLMSREAIDAFLSIKEHDRFTRGLVSWIGFDQCFVTYKANPRFSGTSSYTLKRMFKLAMNAVTTMSSKPLRLSLYLGLVFFATGIIYAFFILSNFFSGRNVEGWTSILITLLILGGIQLFILSIIGEYVSRIFTETKSRPLYLIKKKTR